MLTAEQSFGLSVGYTDESLAGGGAIRGKNCIISDISTVSNGQQVTFSWTLDSGTVQQQSMVVPDGKGIVSIEQNNSKIRLLYNDNTYSDWIDIPTVQGVEGFSPEITVSESTNTVYKLNIKTSNDEFETPNLKGSGGGTSVNVVGEALIFS